MSGRGTIITIGLGFGDEGKGSMVDFLCRHYSAKAVVRYNGGPQAAHHVVLKNKTWHCFSQFGSGTFVPGIRTHLSRQMLVKPSNLLVERDVLSQKGQQDAFRRLTLDPRACIVTPLHGMLCRLQEMARGNKRFGSVGMGVGLAAKDRSEDTDALNISDLCVEKSLLEKLSRHYIKTIAEAERVLEKHPDLRNYYEREMKEASFESLAAFYKTFGELCNDRLMFDEDFPMDIPGKDETIVFEGAQGVLLDARYGFMPHVTKTDVTANSAQTILRSVGGEAVTMGILRAYSTRHGAGPFPAYDENLTARFQETHNATNPWQGNFRVGPFDLLMAKYGLEAADGVDALAVTCLDRVMAQKEIRACTAYSYEGTRTDIGNYFDCEETNEGVRLTRIKAQPSREKQAELSRLLLDCRPLEFQSFDGCDSFVTYLESRKGLNTPVAILSFGPTAEEKVVRRELLPRSRSATRRSASPVAI